MTQHEPAVIVETRMEVRIAAAPDAVWEALTEDIGAWWPDEFYAGGQSGRRSYRLEARPGGRMYEEWDDGGGLLWGSVVSAQPGVALHVTGTLFPEWGGPSVWFGTWRIEPEGDGAVLAFCEHTFGRVTEAQLAEKEKGWRFLLDGALRAHLEGREQPRWAE